MFKKVWIKRALRTFLQTAVSYAAVNVAAINWDGDDNYLYRALIGLAISAGAAGIAAAMNLKETE